MREFPNELFQSVKDEPIVPTLIAVLIAFCVWTFWSDRQENALLKPYARRLANGPISVSVSDISCGCGNKCLSFWRYLRIGPPTDMHDSPNQMPVKEVLGLFCAVCGHEHVDPSDLSRGRKPRELEVYMRQIETRGGEEHAS